jgi:hypothetical protein
MVSPIEKARQEAPTRKRSIALIISGTIVALIFIVWISTFSNRFEEAAEVSEEKVYEPTFVEKIKRKTSLLFEGLEFPQIGSPVEYKQMEQPPKVPTIEEKTGIGTTTNEESFDDIVESMYEEEFNQKEVENSGILEE